MTIPTFRKEWMHKVNDRRVLIFFVGVAATLVVLAVVWQSFAGQRLGIGETDGDWRFRQFLPYGAETVSGGTVALDSPVGSAVVGYSLDGRSYLALVAPDDNRRLGVVSVLDLTALNEMISGLPEVHTEILGQGASPAIVVRLNGAFDSVATVFTAVRNGRIEVIYRIDGGGNRVPAVFFNGNVMEGYESFRLVDVDGDGSPEAVVDGRYVSSGTGLPGFSTSVDVYVWDNQSWTYDKQLSWALTTRDAVFPEPPEDTDELGENAE